MVRQVSGEKVAGSPSKVRERRNMEKGEGVGEREWGVRTCVEETKAKRWVRSEEMRRGCTEQGRESVYILREDRGEEVGVQK
jgi:hypothetical protein